MDYNCEENERRTEPQPARTDAELRVTDESQPFRDGLYFMRCQDMVKIGRTNGIVKRLSHIRGHCPYEIRLEAWFPRFGWQERVWHFAFEINGVRGEWFKWTKDIARAVKAMAEEGEWIHTLRAHPWQITRARKLFAEQPGLSEIWETPRAYADVQRREYIANIEERAASKLADRESDADYE